MNRMKDYFMSDKNNGISRNLPINKDIQETLTWLKETFPQAFAKRLPLKLGIHMDILAQEKENSPSKTLLGKSLNYYTYNQNYLRKLKAGHEGIVNLTKVYNYSLNPLTIF